MEAGMAITLKGDMYSSATLIDNQYKIMVESETAEIINYSLFNKVGQIVYSSSLIAGPFDVKSLEIPMLKDLEPDFYYIKIQVGANTYFSQIVKG
jgi:hypothetical protein